MRRQVAAPCRVLPGAGSVTTISASQLMRMVSVKRLTATLIEMHVQFCCCSPNFNCILNTN
jgi:hypothetical protein